MKHLISLETMAREDMNLVLSNAATFKKQRRGHAAQPLAGQTWALLFSKASTRTRVSFEMAIRELGGEVMFLSAGEIQLGRGEPIKDTARVLGRMVHGAVIRTFAQADVEEFAQYAGIPTINALTDEEHPCQILADVFSIQEKRGSLLGKVVTFLGDGACNVALSWVFAAAKLGFELRIAAPKAFQPPAEVLRRAGVQQTAELSRWGLSGEFPGGNRIFITENVERAATSADVLYTDVWVSMGKEAESKERLQLLAGYQLDSGVVNLAKPGVLVMHCLPAYRGNEISEATFEANAGTIFDQAENRLHAQKAILDWMVS